MQDNKDHTDVMEAIAGVMRLSTDLIVMESVPLDFPLQMEGKRSRRITKGDIVCILSVDGEFRLVDYPGIIATICAITECRGNLYNTIFEVDLKDLKTDELITIKL